MSMSHPEGDSRSSPAGPLTIGYLAWFCLPLALTFLMMSGAAPLVSNGITWMHGAEGERTHLSAFLLTFATCIMIYSPMFISRNVAIRTITCRRSMARYAGFFVSCATVCAGLLVVVSKVDAVGHLLFRQLLGAGPEAERLAREGMLVFTPIPILVALRGLGQGCHISNGQSWYVGLGTALRLGMMGLFVFGYAIHHNLTGPVLGGFTYLTGIATETIFVLATLWNKPQWRTAGDGPVLSCRQFGRYALPLMVGSFFNQLMGPILIHLINKGRQPAENGASFNLIRDTGWMMFSMLMTIQPALVAHATSRLNLRILMRFAGFLLALITGVTILVALTPLREAIFINWLAVDNLVIRQLTFAALLWMIPLPLVNLANLFTSAMHTRSGRTVWVTAGNLVGLTILGLAAVGLDLSSRNGVIIAVIGGAVFNLTTAAVQTIGLLNGGVQAAISSATLVEQLNKGRETTQEATGDTKPVPERVRA